MAILGKIIGGPSPASVDIQGTELILDADGDTTITADTDDQIDFKIAGADDFRMTANTLSVLSGTTLNIDSGATITNSGTANNFGVALANDGDNRVVTGTGSGGLNGEANLSFDGTTLAVTGTVEPSGDTAAGDNAAIGYTSAEGLILTGQGSTDDITIKNDADTTVLNVATGGTDVEISAGNLLFGTADKGIYLGVTSATAANLLDDYEMGSFTVTILDAGLDDDGQTYNNQTGYYAKIGSQVHVNGLVRLAGAGNLTGSVNLGGFPFTTINTASRFGVVNVGYMTGANQDATGQTVTGITAQNATYAYLYEWDSTEGTTALQFGGFSTNNYFWFSCLYTAA